ncbi:MAG: hypothetical protein ABIJ34_08465 [archaeon]
MTDKKIFGNSALLLLQCFLIFLSLLLQTLKEVSFSKILFWVLYLGAVLATYALVLQKNDNGKLLSLFVLDLFILSIFSFNFPYFYQVDRDTGFETQFAKTIIENKYWNPTLGTGFTQDYYGYNPVLHILLAFISIISKTSVDLLAKYVVSIIFRMLILYAIYRLLSLIFKNKQHVFLTLFIYLITPRLRILMVSRRLVAVYFMLLCLYLIIKKSSIKISFSDILLYFVLSVMLVLSDHSTSLIFLMFLLIGTIYYAVVNLIGIVKQNIFFVPLIISGFANLIWEGVFAKRLLLSNIGYLSEITSFIGNIAQAPTSTVSVDPIVYSLLEKLWIYSGHIAIVFICLVGFVSFGIKFYRKKEILLPEVNDKILFSYLAIFGLLGYIISLGLAQSQWGNFTNVFIWFPLIPVACLVSILLFRFQSENILSAPLFRIASAVLIMVVFAGGLLAEYHPVVFYPFNESGVLMEFKEYKKPEIYYSGQWLSENAARTSVIVADRSIFDIYGGYFGFEQALLSYSKEMYLSDQSYYEKRILKWPIWTGSYKWSSVSAKTDYVIVNRDVIRIRSDLLGEPLPPSFLEKFDKVNLTERIYDNGLIQIYRKGDRNV